MEVFFLNQFFFGFGEGVSRTDIEDHEHTGRRQTFKGASSRARIYHDDTCIEQSSRQCVSTIKACTPAAARC